nr:LacI family DNA-binding transcriptional regulator [uncultured Oscillibacter sp.]
MKRVTVRDIAALAGVSTSTVSRALNDHPAISPQTKKAVRDACEALNYVPDFTAKGLSGHETHTIGIVVPDISNPYFSALCTAMEGRAAAAGYRVILINTLHDPAYELDAIDQLLSHRVDGMLITACSPGSQEEHRALLGSTPCVYLGSNHGPRCSYVEADNARGAYEAAQYLRLLGHRGTVFLGGRQGSRTLEQRLSGYRRSMALNGLPCREITWTGAESGLLDWCGEQAEALFRSGECPDAILAYSDMAAVRVLEAAEACGLRVPEDFSLVGFDNITFGGLPQIGLTTVSQRKFQAGRLAVDRLLEKIGGAEARTEDVLPPELIIRSTCRKREEQE